MTDKPRQVYQLSIDAPAQRVWDAITRGELTERYFHGTFVRSDLTPGASFNYYLEPEGLMVEGSVIEADPPRRLVHTWHMVYDPELAADAFSTITYEIEPRSEASCVLTLVHEFESEDATFRKVGGGWSWVLEGLKGVAESAEPLAYVRESARG